MRIALSSFAVFSLIVFGAGCARFEVDSISPSEIPAGQDSDVTISGAGFGDGVEFELSAPGLVVTLAALEVDATRALVRVPAAIPAGVYSVVANVDGQQAILEDALSVISGKTRLVFIDVSQGDATLVIAPDGETILIDGGKRESAALIETALEDFSGGRLDAIIVSHFDADHLGGVVEILSGPDGRPGNDDDLVVDTVWAPADENTCSTLLCGDMRRLRTNFETPAVGQKLIFGEFTLEVLSVGGDIGAGPVAGTDDENERSLAVLISFAGSKAVLTGDLTGGGLGTVDLETPVAQRIGPVDVVQVAHHGSASSSPQSALDAYQARAAIFSMGEDNAFCHPQSGVFTRWNESGAALYGTTAGIVFDAQYCDGATPVPARGRFGVGDVVVDFDAAGTITIDGDVIAP